MRSGYAWASTRPLHILVFLLPLVIAYEVGSAVYLAPGMGAGPGAGAGAERTIRAERLLSSFFEWFGVSGLYLPGVLLVAVLLIWHFLSHDRWRVRPGVLGGMAIESIVWTIPLLVLGQLVFRVFGGSPELSASATGPGAWGGLPALVGPALAGSGLSDLSRPALATISVGAGLYEELLFRLVLIAVVHAIAADVMGLRDTPSKVIAVAVSALAFAFYHDVWNEQGQLDAARLAIFLVAGGYFGAVYVLRGFGIVVAVHALYDLAVLVLLPVSA